MPLEVGEKTGLFLWWGWQCMCVSMKKNKRGKRPSWAWLLLLMFDFFLLRVSNKVTWPTLGDIIMHYPSQLPRVAHTWQRCPQKSRAALEQLQQPEGPHQALHTHNLGHHREDHWGQRPRAEAVEEADHHQRSVGSGQGAHRQQHDEHSCQRCPQAQ